MKRNFRILLSNTKYQIIFLIALLLGIEVNAQVDDSVPCTGDKTLKLYKSYEVEVDYDLTLKEAVGQVGFDDIYSEYINEINCPNILHGKKLIAIDLYYRGCFIQKGDTTISSDGISMTTINNNIEISTEDMLSQLNKFGRFVNLREILALIAKYPELKAKPQRFSFPVFGNKFKLKSEIWELLPLIQHSLKHSTGENQYVLTVGIVDVGWTPIYYFALVR